MCFQVSDSELLLSFSYIYSIDIHTYWGYIYIVYYIIGFEGSLFSDKPDNGLTSKDRY